MNRLKKYFSLLVFLFIALCGFAQGYSLKKYSLKSGQHFEDIYGITQDSNGTLWLLQRTKLTEFDGQKFIDHIFPRSMRGTGDALFRVDDSGAICCGSYYDEGKFIGSQHDTIEDYRADIFMGIGSRKENLISSGETDRFGNLWIKNQAKKNYRFYKNKMFQLDEKNGLNLDELDTIYYKFSHENAGMENFILDNKGYAWLRARKGLYKFSGKKFDYLKCEHDEASKIFEDSKGRLWICSGLYPGKIFCYKNGTKKTFDESKVDSTGISNIVEDINGGLWFKSGNGIFKTDGEKIHYYIGYKNYNLRGADKMGNVILSSSYADENTTNTICLFNGKKLNVIYSTTKSIYLVFIDKEGNIWFKSHGELCELLASNAYTKEFSGLKGYLNEYTDIRPYFVSKTGRILVYIYKEGIFELKNDSIIPLIIDKKLRPQAAAEDTLGTIWIPTQSLIPTKDAIAPFYGIYRLNGREFRKFHSRVLDPYIGKYLGGPWCKLELNGNGFPLFITASKAGVFEYDGRDFVQYSLPDSIKNIEPVVDIDKRDVFFKITNSGEFFSKAVKYSILKFDKIKRKYENFARDVDGLFAFKDSFGYYHFGAKELVKDGDAVILKDSLLKNINELYSAIITDHFESQDCVWLISDYGLVRMNVIGPKKYEIASFEISDGLSSSVVQDIKFDKSGKLWVSSSQGIDIIDVPEYRRSKRKIIHHFPDENGITSEGNFLNINDSNIHFMTTSEYDIIDANLRVTNGVAPKTLFTSISWVIDSTYVIYNTSGEVVIPYNFNPLTINFTGVCLTDGSKVKYKYFLRGFDKNVQEQSERTVKYSSLPPGDYTFEVMACNNDGVWNDKPVKFSFTVLPPWYRTWWFYGLCFIIIGGGVYGFIAWRTRALRDEKERLEKTVVERTAEVVKQKALLEEKNKDILDSITYAKRLQDAILPPVSIIRKYLPESFVLYKPKDIVAGDFYWMEQSGDNILIAAADCTGHGVPGAMVSVVCSNALNRAVKEFKVNEPGRILDKVRELVLETFEKSESAVKDGMDISLCCINTHTKEVQWSGAYNPLWYIQNNELKEIAPDKQPIGMHDNAKPFNTHELKLQKGDILYLFTDGYADQFGGPKGKKFKYKQLEEKLLAITSSGMDKQKDMLNETIENWKGSLEQIDDILIIGIKV